jgi:hypothetical protein
MFLAAVFVVALPSSEVPDGPMNYLYKGGTALESQNGYLLALA